MRFVTIIPARGGSKRFPRKNITDFLGVPLIVHSITESLNCGKICRTFVSTDDEDIKKISTNAHAEIIDRPIALGGDLTTTVDVLQHCAKTLIGLGVEFDYIVLLQATNPLRPNKLLDTAIDIIESGVYDSLFTVSPCCRKLGRITDGHFLPWNYHYGQRSQDMEPLYYENGLLYISSKQLVLEGRIMGDNIFPMIVEDIYGTVDIDTKEDMDYAEFIANRYPKC